MKRGAQPFGESDSELWRMLFTNMKAAHARLSFDNVLWFRGQPGKPAQGTNWLTL